MARFSSVDREVYAVARYGQGRSYGQVMEFMLLGYATLLDSHDFPREFILEKGSGQDKGVLYPLSELS